MGQALSICMDCEMPRNCDSCTDLHNWIMDALEEKAELQAYRDTGLEPDQINKLCDMDRRAKMADMLRLEEYQAIGPIDRLRELAQSDRNGQLIKLPFVAMIEQSLQDGKMKPERDQRFNGRYAVVYSDPEKWKSPLIDICGTHYDRHQAEKRLQDLTRAEAEAALGGVRNE